MRTTAVRTSVAPLLAVIGVVGCSLPPAEPTVPDPAHGLSVQVSYQVMPLGDDRGQLNAVVRFRNHGPNPVWVLEPLDGSTDGRQLPDYRFTVTDPTGHQLPPLIDCGFCGLWADTVWPRDYLVEILPGAEFEVRLESMRVLHDPGRYTVRFAYSYLPANPEFAPPAEAWRGTAESAATVIEWAPLR